MWTTSPSANRPWHNSVLTRGAIQLGALVNLLGAPFISVPIKACDTLIEHTSLSKGYGAMAKPVRPLWGCQTENSKTASDVVSSCGNLNVDEIHLGAQDVLTGWIAVPTHVRLGH
jgi:hypothetical protein